MSVQISRQAISKRFNKNAVTFLKGCLGLQLTKIASLTDSVKQTLSSFNRVIVFDSTQWQLKEALKERFKGYSGGASAAACKLQTVIDVLAGKILLFDYHAATRPDQGYGKEIADLFQSRDLLLFDLGYYCAEFFKRIINLRAFFICPMYSNSTVRKADQKRSTSIAALLGKTTDQSFDCWLMIGSKDPLPLRVVAFRNSEHKAAQLRKKLREFCRKQRSQPTKAQLVFCDWTALLTNVTNSQMKSTQVLQAYGTRWQVEIFFRDAKSHLHLNASSSKSEYRFEVQLLAVLFVATLLCFIQGRFNNSNIHDKELSLQKLINRFAESAYPIYLCLLKRKLKQLTDIFDKLLLNSIKFHQPSRKTTRQIIISCDLS